MRRLLPLLVLAACTAPPPEAPPAQTPPAEPQAADPLAHEFVVDPAETEPGFAFRHYSERMDVGPLIEQVARQVGWNVRVAVGVDDSVDDLPQAPADDADVVPFARELIADLVARFGLVEERLPDGTRFVSYPHHTLLRTGGADLHDVLRLVALYAGYYPQLDPAIPPDALTDVTLQGDWRTLLRTRLLQPGVFDYEIDDDDGTLQVFPLPRPKDMLLVPHRGPDHVRLLAGRLARDGDRLLLRSSLHGDWVLEFPAGVELPNPAHDPRIAIRAGETPQGDLEVSAWIVEAR